MSCLSIPVVSSRQFWGTSWSFVLTINSVNPTTGIKTPLDMSLWVAKCGFDTTYDNDGTNYLILPADVTITGAVGTITVLITNPVKTQVSVTKIVGDIRYKTSAASTAEMILARIEVEIEPVTTTSLA